MASPVNSTTCTVSLTAMPYGLDAGLSSDALSPDPCTARVLDYEAKDLGLYGVNKDLSAYLLNQSQAQGDGYPANMVH
jgi:hypothetical protein